jgi:hypothetical protein
VTEPQEARALAIQTSRFCNECRKKTLHHKAQLVTDGMGCLITIVSAGLFLLIWGPAILWMMVFPQWRCQICGTRN